MVSFHGDAGDVGILQGLEGLNGAGEGAGEDLASVEQIAGDEDEIHPSFYGIGHYAAERGEEVLVACSLICGSTVCFAEVDVGGMDKGCHGYAAIVLVNLHKSSFQCKSHFLNES